MVKEINTIEELLSVCKNYIESKESESQKYISTHSMKDYPNFLKKKVNLLLKFSSILFFKLISSITILYFKINSYLALLNI